MALTTEQELGLIADGMYAILEEKARKDPAVAAALESGKVPVCAPQPAVPLCAFGISPLSDPNYPWPSTPAADAAAASSMAFVAIDPEQDLEVQRLAEELRRERAEHCALAEELRRERAEHREELRRERAEHSAEMAALREQHAAELAHAVRREEELQRRLAEGAAADAAAAGACPAAAAPAAPPPQDGRYHFVGKVYDWRPGKRSGKVAADNGQEATINKDVLGGDREHLPRGTWIRALVVGRREGGKFRVRQLLEYKLPNAAPPRAPPAAPRPPQPLSPLLDDPDFMPGGTAAAPLGPYPPPAL